MKKEHPVLLGAHMSIEGGIEEAFYRGASIGCTAIQIFTHSNRQWAVKELKQTTIEATKKAQKKTAIEAMVHASYLINLGSESAETVKKSIATLEKELLRCQELSINCLVLHPGSGNANETGCMEQISDGLNELFEKTDDSTVVLLETMAGQGKQVGRSFEQLAYIKSKIHNKKRIGFCIDTCHLWAAGYDFSTQEGYQRVWQEFDTILGLSHLRALHLNDSKQHLGSRVDRHQDIGKGTISLEAFRLIMNDSRLQLIPKILETPSKELHDYAHYIQVLRSLIAK